MAGLTGKFTVLPHGKLDSRPTIKTNLFQSANNWVSLSGQAAQQSSKEGSMTVTHLLKLIGRWAFLKPAGEMEDVGVPRGFSPSLSGQSAQYSVLPTYLGNNEKSFQEAVLHTAEVYVTH